MVKLKVSWCLAASVIVSNCEQFSLLWPLLFDSVYSNGLMPSVGYNHESTRFVDADTSASVHGGGESTWQGADGLNKSQCRSSLEASHVFASLGSSVNFLQKLSINFEDSNRRAELIDDVCDVVLGVEFEVARTIWLSGTETRWHDIHLHFDGTLTCIIVEFTDEVLSKVRHESNASNVGIQDKSMRVRICLSNGNGGLIIERVVDASRCLDTCHHLLSSLRIIHTLYGTSQRATFVVEGDDNQSRIPVVYS
mmetsp:Transcript_43242/g.125028  ORF Transcript_43242/g.125028 Transcript_43242/m.125028 type:complete len:252 (-) Transcript_43242:575-1330(-)